MRHSIVALFLVGLLCSVAAINFVTPSYANDGDGSSGEKGESGDQGLSTHEWVKNKKLTGSDVRRMTEKQQSGTYFQWIGHAALSTGTNMTELFTSIGPYYPALFAKISNVFNSTRLTNKKHLMAFLEYIKKIRRKMIAKIKIVKEVGNPTQEKILEKIKSALEATIKNAEKDLKILPLN